jgi:pyruvate,water dikinase
MTVVQASRSDADQPGDGLVLAMRDCGPDRIDEVGGKAVGLGALIRAGQRVPTAFVVTSSAYRYYCDERALPDGLRDAIAAAYAALSDREVPTAVRSSATIEDSTAASCAGQFSTFLGAAGADEIVARVEECWLSAFSPHLDAYRTERRIGTDDAGVAVIVQELVNPRAAGVMFTRHPSTGDRSVIVIEASYGLGEAVVGGDVTPDLFEINKITRDVHRRKLGVKALEHRLAPDGRTVTTVPVAGERQQAWSVAEEDVDALVDMALSLEATLGPGLDIEWAIGTTASAGEAEALFALQVRAITVDPRRRGATKGGSAIDLILGRLSGSTAEGDGRR